MRRNRPKKIIKIPYDSLSDDEKVRKNWQKTIRLYKRKEWSVAILRCATCIELAVNFAIRQEMAEDRKLPLPFVNKLLKNSNGIHHKYQNIYLPIMEEYEEHEELKKLWSDSISKTNTERNAVAHKGEFRNKLTATEIMKHTYHVLSVIFEIHSSNAKLKELEI